MSEIVSAVVCKAMGLARIKCRDIACASTAEGTPTVLDGTPGVDVPR